MKDEKEIILQALAETGIGILFSALFIAALIFCI